MSLRTRLVLLFAILGGSLVLGAASTASRASYDSLIRQVDERLFTATQELLADEATGTDLRVPAGDTIARVDVGSDGTVVASRPSGLTSPDPLPALPADVLTRDRTPVTVDAVDSSVQYRLTTVEVAEGQRVVLAASLEQVDTAMGRIGLALLFGGLLSLLGVGALAALFIRRETRKLDVLASTADAFAVGDFATRAPVREDASEVGRVATAMNSMLDRIEESVNEEAAAKERLQSFVDDVSHELRTPLTTIQGYAELYAQGGLPDDDAVRRAMGRIEAESGRMASLVEEMLVLARLDMVRPPRREVVDVASVVEAVIADAAVTAPDRRVTAQALPSLLVMGDPDRLQQAVSNLVTNAVTHTPDTATVCVEGRLEDGDVVVEVRDDAGGIDPADLPHLFDRGWRRGDGSADGGSVGLGLAIVRRIVEEHQGSVSATSSPAEGTRFTVRLPRGLPLAALEAAAPEAGSDRGVEPTAGRPAGGRGAVPSPAAGGGASGQPVPVAGDQPVQRGGGPL
jgi:two-component system OmpR family sensor kinase